MKKIRIEIAQTGMGKTINQDYAVSTENLAVVLDGCGSGEHSEVGSSRMGEAIRKHSMKLNEQNFESFANDTLQKFLMENTIEKRFIDEFQFTIVACIETKKEFIVLVAGDGFVITVDKLNNIRYIQLDNDVNVANGEAPRYIAYNFNPSPSRYNRNVYFDKIQFSKSLYSSVYVASDGFRFILDDKFPADERTMIQNALIQRDQSIIEMVLKRNQSKILDDISISSWLLKRTALFNHNAVFFIIFTIYIISKMWYNMYDLL